MPSEAQIDRISPEQVPVAAAALGAGGLIPFLAGTSGLYVLDGPALDMVTTMLHGYAVVILAFMGAVHWGLAMTAPAPGTVMTASVVPALAGWFTLALEARFALPILAVCFAGLYVYDLARIAAGGAPTWYRRLRTPLTSVVVLCLLASSVALWQTG